MQKPLEGLKVLDLSRVLAGPYCTMLMGDMGADVVKVELPGKGDDTRGYGPPFASGESAYFLSVNRSKRSITLNLKTEAGLKILEKMIGEADVLVENFRRGTMEKFGYGYEASKEINPRLIYCSITGYGHSGPYADLPGYDLIVQGEGGIASLTGDAEGPPYKVGTSQADIVAGMNAFQGILLALLARERTGKGQKVDVALLDCQVSLLTYQAGIYFMTGESPNRMGNQHPTITPYETFECQDGYINVACGNERIWERFCDASGLEALATDERFSTNAKRVENREALEAALTPVMKLKSAQAWIELLRPASVPCGRIQSVSEVCENEQVLAREMVVVLQHPAAGEVQVTGVPIKLSETPGSVETAPPTLGQHSAEILNEWVGVEEEEFFSLKENGVL